jgi:23S rRNA (pseudouridine1915-N3)-methyltransferase
VKLSVLAVGKLKEPGLRALCDDYRLRIARHCDVVELEFKDEAALLKAIPKDAKLVALQVHGRALTSTQLSEHVVRWGSSGNGQVCFAIGGANGFGAQMAQRAAFELSLSSLTLPHRLARLILLEQLYRALAIWRGEPYAREE